MTCGGGTVVVEGSARSAPGAAPAADLVELCPIPTASVSLPMRLAVDPRPSWETSPPSDVGLTDPATGPSADRATTVGSGREDRPAPPVADDEPPGLSVGVPRDPPPALSDTDPDTGESPPDAADSDTETGLRTLRVSESGSPAARFGPSPTAGACGTPERLPPGAGSSGSGTDTAASRCSSRCGTPSDTERPSTPPGLVEAVAAVTDAVGNAGSPSR
ncbi:hypothetical protein [Mycobacterium simiae]|uniref:hypothetical protein n=1 Tax=Mycobacterium simiae TaxID=1784 RepID=UPI00111BF354|nr:hypothetical protein [Mycobacterium simiae]